MAEESQREKGWVEQEGERMQLCLLRALCLSGGLPRGTELYSKLQKVARSTGTRAKVTGVAKPAPLQR